MSRSVHQRIRIAVATVLSLYGCIPGELVLDHRDAAVEASAGKAGNAGSAGNAPEDCASVCAEGCIKGTWPPACESCVLDVCAAYDQRFLDAPGANAYVSCVHAATDDESWQKCCMDHLQACDADMIEGSCACGFIAAGCKSDCSSLCGDELPATICDQCIPLSRCALAWYDYHYHAETDAFVKCMGCAAGHCLALCCNQYSEACELFKAMRSCVCG